MTKSYSDEMGKSMSEELNQCQEPIPSVRVKGEAGGDGRREAREDGRREK
jgi:hypothetical protein